MRMRRTPFAGRMIVQTRTNRRRVCIRMYRCTAAGPARKQTALFEYGSAALGKDITGQKRKVRRMAIQVGINGFGRIGRLVFRAATARNDIKIVGINDPFLDPDYMLYLLKYDSVHGRFKGEAEVKDGKLVVNGQEIAVFKEREPASIKWG